MIKEFLRLYVRRYSATYALGVAFLIATNWLTVKFPQLLKQVFDELAGQRRLDVVHQYACWIALCAVVVIVVRTLSRIAFFNPGRTIEFRIRNDMLQRLLTMSPAFFRNWKIGDIMARASDDATFVRALVGFTSVMLINTVLAALMSVYQMWRTDAWLTLYCVVPLVLSVLALRFGVTYTMTMMRQTQKSLGALSNTVLETYKGIAVVQGAAAETAFLKRFDKDNDEFTSLALRGMGVRTILMPVVGVVGNVCIFLLLFVGGEHVMQGRMTVGDMAAYASYVAVLVGALVGVGWVVGVLQRGSVSLRRVWDVIEIKTDLPVGVQPLPQTTGGIDLRIDHLTWRHPDAEPAQLDAISDVSLHVKPGQILGIYGTVASGKSTLVSIISRLAVPPRGSVFIDGVDLLDVRSADLRRDVAVVPQDAFLFSRSIKDNVAFIARSEEADMAAVDRAVQSAALAPEIARFPDGLNTTVGERGQTLSGGQRQRVQLARAFYRGYRLLILDDVLSAVDHDTEARLLEVLQKQIAERGTSAIIISHRLSALARADQIVVLDHGRMIEQGTHSELLANEATYAHIWQNQRDHAEEPEDAAVVTQVAA